MNADVAAADVKMFKNASVAAAADVKMFKEPQEQNCAALLAFVSMLWCTEALPLYITSTVIPLLAGNPLITSNVIPLLAGNPLITFTVIPLLAGNQLITSTVIPLLAGNPLITSAVIPLQDWITSDGFFRLRPQIFFTTRDICKT